MLSKTKKQSTCSEEYTDEHPRAPSAGTGFRKGLHQIELLCRAEGRRSSRNSYSHAAYPRQRASGTCMVQPSRLGIVCFPYRHLSWFAVRRSGICLLLCAACAPLCQSALSPWRICKRFAQARPHSDTGSRMDFSRLFNICAASSLQACRGCPHSVLGAATKPADSDPAGEQTD